MDILGKIKELAETGERIRIEEEQYYERQKQEFPHMRYRPHSDGFNKFFNDVEIFMGKYLSSHVMHEKVKISCETHSIAKLIPLLNSIADDMEWNLDEEGGIPEKKKEGENMDLRERLSALIDEGKKVEVDHEAERSRSARSGIIIAYGVGPKSDGFGKWASNVRIISTRYLASHPLKDSIDKALDAGNYLDIIGGLEAIIDDEEFFTSAVNKNIQSTEQLQNFNQVFIVHGHDAEAKEKVARFVEKLGLEAIVLHEKVSGGRTVIEKIEEYADVGFAIVLYTPCDKGNAIEEKGLNNRARQNVVFEHGYMIGKLGRAKVYALKKGDIELPGDYDGVIYEIMDDGGAWKYKAVDEMKAAGYQVSKDAI